MNPKPFDPSTQVRLVPSLVAPSQTLLVQPLYPNTRPLSEQDLFVLQRTVVPAGQLWLYSLTNPGLLPCPVQIRMWTTPTLAPLNVLGEPQVKLPDQLHISESDLTLLASMSGYAADDEAAKSDLTGAIYGD